MMFRLALSAVLLSLVPGSAMNPVTGDRQLSMTAGAQEIQLGRPAVIGRGLALTEPVAAFLSGVFDLRLPDVRVLDDRRPVARALDAADDREISTIGAVRVEVPAQFYIERLRDIAAFKRSDAVREIGVFSSPARPDHAAALTLDADDLEDLGRCRPGACEVQLPSALMVRLAREVPWHTGQAAPAANRILREALANMVNRYREIGDAALFTYVDGDQPLTVSQEFRAMIASPPKMLSRFPMLRDHFLHFPATRGTGIDDIVYWSKEKIGPASVISVTHMAIAQVSARPRVFVAASRQLFSTHYFDASLGLTAVVQDPAHGIEHSYVVYTNRSRVDAFDGVLGGLKRAIVRRRVRSTISNYLAAARDRVERQFEIRRESMARVID